MRKFIKTMAVISAAALLSFGTLSCSNGSDDSGSANNTNNTKKFILSEPETYSANIEITKNNGTYVIKNSSLIEENKICFELTNIESGPIYFNFTIKSNDSDKTLKMYVNTENRIIRSNFQYLANIDLSVKTSAENHKYLFFIDEAAHKDNIADICFRIPENSEIEISSVDCHCVSDYSQNYYRIYTKKGYIEEYGYIYGIINEDDSVDFIYNFSKDEKFINNYDGWEVSGRYNFSPKEPGLYLITVDAKNVEDPTIFEIQKNFDPYESLYYGYISTGVKEFSVNIPEECVGKEITLNVRPSKTTFDETDHKMQINRFTVEKQ